MKPALEKFLIIAATLAAIGIFIFISMWTSIKGKKTQMDDLFNSTNVPTSYIEQLVPDSDPIWAPRNEVILTNHHTVLHA